MIGSDGSADVSSAWTIHARLLEAGWSYRAGGHRDWIIYRDPQTGSWHPPKDAISIQDARSMGPAKRRNGDGDPNLHS